MSAIAGVWSPGGALDTARTCQQMLAALRVYSGGGTGGGLGSGGLRPSGEGAESQISRPGIALGRVLLRLLPEDRFEGQFEAQFEGGFEEGHQRRDQGGTAGRQTSPGAVLVCDVRLDNRDDLGRELELPASRVAAMADSQLVKAAWQRWGQECVHHLLGAFAFAVWDEERQELFLARDHTGERPLYYHPSPGCFAFASMPKGLHPVPAVGAEIDEDYVARYLTLAMMPVERTIFQRMVRLPAGHAMLVRAALAQVEVRQWRYWRTDQVPELRLRGDEDYLELLRAQFDLAVRARLRSTGGIGAQLSGGLDSSAVAATAARILEEDGRELTVYTAVPRAGFATITDANHFCDEGPAAAEVAACYPNMRHVRVDASNSSFLDILDRSSELYDHPSFTPSNEVWADAIFARAWGAGVTALLNGNCGNSTISSYGMGGLAEWFRRGRWLTLARVGWQLRRTGNASLKSIARQAVSPSLPFWLRERADPHLRGFSLDYSVAHPALVARLGLERQAFRDLHTTLPGGRTMLHMLLTYGDFSETTMAPQGGWQIDFRDPTFDKRIVEFCLAVPLEQFVRGGQLRSLARRAFADRLPASTVARTARGRQSADWYVSLTALRPRMAAEVESLAGSPLARRCLDLERMRWLIEHWPSSGFERPEISRAYHLGLTRGLSMGRFLRRYDPDAR